MRIIAHSARDRDVDPATVLRRALESSADRIELDVLALGDRLVVAHDARAARRGATLGFEAALEAIAQAGLDLLADLKNAAAAGPLGDAIAAAGHGPRTLVCGDLSPIDVVAKRCGARAAWTLPATGSPGPAGHAGPLGLATPASLRRVRRAAVWALSEGTCDGVSVDRRFVTQPLVDAVHDAGGEVIVWTVERATELQRLDALGVDEVATDDPAAARRALGR